MAWRWLAATRPAPPPLPAVRVDAGLKVWLHQRLLGRLSLDRLASAPRETLRAELSAAIVGLLNARGQGVGPADLERLVEDVIDELFGLGPLEPLLRDPSITDILVNTHDAIFVERGGRLVRVEACFEDDRHLMRIIHRIVSSVGRRVDEATPMVDARLADGSRVNVIVPPVAVDGPLLSIRKFAAQPLSLERLTQLGALDEAMAGLLAAAVRSRRSIMISGGAGSGKTTLLNALSSCIDEAERIVTIEDAAELRLQHPHVARLETRPPTIEGDREVAQQDLLRNALRMRPDRIIVGEVRAGEAFGMLQAMNSGQDGSMTTIHANTPREAIWRVEQLVALAGVNIPQRSLREQIASALHMIVHLDRMEDGVRRVTAICEVAGMAGDDVHLRELHRFRPAAATPGEAGQGCFEVVEPGPLRHARAGAPGRDPDGSR